MRSRPLTSAACGKGLAGTSLTRRQFWTITTFLGLLMLVSFFTFDRIIAEMVHELPRPVLLFHRQITKLGIAGPYLICTLLLSCIFWWRARHAKLLCERVREWSHAAANLYIFISVSLSGLVINAIKMFVGRPRPYLYTNNSSIYFEFDPFPLSAMWKSFPSGHTNTAFAMALAVGFFLPKWRTPLLILACIVGASRVYVGAHYPSDVIGGAFIAYLTTYPLRQWWQAKYKLPFRD